MDIVLKCRQQKRAYRIYLLSHLRNLDLLNQLVHLLRCSDNH